MNINKKLLLKYIFLFLHYKSQSLVKTTMTDIHSTATRSYNMSMVKGKNTKPELIVRKYLFSKGLRYRINVNCLPGKPDIVLLKYHTVIFINCFFWHGHTDSLRESLPKTRTDWWRNKINCNIERDKKNYLKLTQMGWHVITIWECQLKSKIQKQTLISLEFTLNSIFLDSYRK